MEENVLTKRFALIGRNISYSFSRGYFTEKFQKLGLENCEYVNFDLAEISELKATLATQVHELGGMNVTIPYKLAIFDFLDELDEEAREIGAVNTVQLLENGGLKGYNTDVYGFRVSLAPLLPKGAVKALILGTGGASKAVAYALKQLEVPYTFVSRSASEKSLTYDALTPELIATHTLIVNCTPLGTFPDVEQCPDIPYEGIGEGHLLYDLIYNPAETAFLKNGRLRGAQIKNGLEMLEQQAEKAWEIWNSNQ